MGLRGKRVVVTRPVGQAESLCLLLEEQQAVPVEYPTIQITPFKPNQELRNAFRDWGTYDWVIFTSVNGVEVFFDEAEDHSFDVIRAAPSPAVAAIGPATAQALKQRGMPAHAVPEEFVAERIIGVLGPIAGNKILLPRAQKARKILREQLELGHAHVVEIPTYDTAAPAPRPNDDLLDDNIDAVTFTSSSTVDGFVTLLGERALRFLSQTCVACIGPITADTARARGISVDVVAKDYTTQGLVKALVEHFDE